jgi:hypothetical protein
MNTALEPTSTSNSFSRGRLDQSKSDNSTNQTSLNQGYLSSTSRTHTSSLEQDFNRHAPLNFHQTSSGCSRPTSSTNARIPEPETASHYSRIVTDGPVHPHSAGQSNKQVRSTTTMQLFETIRKHRISTLRAIHHSCIARKPRCRDRRGT